MDNLILEAQRTLEEKQVSLKQTEPTQISSDDTICYETISPRTCDECGEKMHRYFVFGDYSDICHTCNNKRMEEREQSLKVLKEKQKRKEIEDRITSRLNGCNIGQRFMGMTFQDYKPSNQKAEKVLASCVDYVQNFTSDSGCNVLMIGSPGTGKNMMAAIIGQEIIKRDFSFFHTTAIKLVRRIKDTWRNKDESEQEVINSFVGPSLLVIDEIGVQFGSQTEQLFLTEVINERYEKRRPTILISNLKLSQLTEVMGERVIDRFYDDGSKLMVFDWSSYRRNGISDITKTKA